MARTYRHAPLDSIESHDDLKRFKRPAALSYGLRQENRISRRAESRTLHAIRTEWIDADDTVFSRPRRDYWDWQ